MSVENGDLAQMNYNRLNQWSGYSIYRVFDSIAMSDVAVSPLPTQEYVATTVMGKIIQVVVGRMTVVFPAQLVLLPHQDPRSYGTADAAVDDLLAQNSQVWRECMMYMQRNIVLITSMVQELQTLRVAMNTWLPDNTGDMTALGQITQAGVDLDAQFTEMFEMFRHVTPEAFFQAAPTMSARLTNVVDVELWPAVERLWRSRSRADLTSLRLNGVIAVDPWPYADNPIGHVGRQCDQQNYMTWASGTYHRTPMGILGGTSCGGVH